MSVHGVPPNCNLAHPKNAKRERKNTQVEQELQRLAFLKRKNTKSMNFLNVKFD